MLNPIDLVFGKLREIRLAYLRWKTNSVPLQLLGLIMEVLRKK